MAKLTAEQKAKLKSLPIQGYMDWKGIKYVKESATSLRGVEHDSLVVRTNRNQFVWNSTGYSGDLVNFIHYYELGKGDADSKSEALKRRMAYGRYVQGEHIDVAKVYQAKPNHVFDWQKIRKSSDVRDAKEYLVKERRLNEKFVNKLFEQGQVFQGVGFNYEGTQQAGPVLFPWKDVDGKVVGADKQGTTQDFNHFSKRGTLKQIIGGSNTRTGYNLGFGKGNETLVLFESPIDLLSYAQQNHAQLTKENARLLSVSGTDAKRGGFVINDYFAAKKGNFNKIILATDKDLAGCKAADFYRHFHFRNPLTKKELTVVRHVPKYGKDWNEQLQHGETGFDEWSMDKNEEYLKQLQMYQDEQADQSNIKQLERQPSKQASQLTSVGQKPSWQQKKKLTPAERKAANRAKNKAIIDQAVQQIRSYNDDPQELKKLLDFTAKGLQYSARNTLLIYGQKNDATLIKGYNQWKEAGIQVNKGEKGIRIFGHPVETKTIVTQDGQLIPWKDASPEQKELANAKKLPVQNRNFYPAEAVFDITQTNARPEQLPKLLPNRPLDLKTEQNPAQLKKAYQALTKYASQLGVEVLPASPQIDQYLHEKQLTANGAAKGAYMQSRKEPSKQQIVLRSDLTPTDRVHTLAHEVAHAKLHGQQRQSAWPTEIKEIQAEMSSYVVSKSLGIDPGEQSIRYMANWSDQLKKIPAKDFGKVMNQTVSASTGVTQFLNQHLQEPQVKQVAQQKQSQQQVQSSHRSR